MNRATFDEEFEQFRTASIAAGIQAPRSEDRLPVLNEDTPTHTSKELCADYVLHCSWAARMLAKNKPRSHVDFGSYSYFSALCCHSVPAFAFMDIRPLGFEVPGMASGISDLTNLLFVDGGLPSISCLHVIEHVGLGRYGDTLDPLGHIKAAKELVRVLAVGGKLLIVLPMCKEPRVVFNAHRILSLPNVIDMFAPCRITDSTYLYNEKFHAAPPQTGEFTGCFEFTK